MWPTGWWPGPVPSPPSPCGGPVLPGHRRSGAGPAQPGAVVDPDRVAAICPLALVGCHHRGHPRALVLVVAVVPGRLDPQLLLASSPFSDQALGGVLLVATRVALAVTALAVVVAAGSLVVRFRRTHGVEHQQLRWVALGAAVMVLAVPVVLVAVALGIPI